MPPIRTSPLGGQRPRREELARFADGTVDDVVCPHPRLLVVGINPRLWTAAVNAPFAHPGNRFWPSLHPAELNASELRSGAERIRSLGADVHFVGFGMALTSWSAQQA